MIPGTYSALNSIVKINDAPSNTMSIRIEGQDATNGYVPATPAQNQPSVDAIEEYAIQTSNFAAEYGQVGGGFFNLTMKSGSNRFHGSAYDYFVNEALNAGQPFTDDRRDTWSGLLRVEMIMTLRSAGQSGSRTSSTAMTRINTTGQTTAGFGYINTTAVAVQQHDRSRCATAAGYRGGKDHLLTTMGGRRSLCSQAINF